MVLIRKTRSSKPSFIREILSVLDKMCVPEDLLELCQQMAAQETKSTAKIICIPARDRYCLPSFRPIFAHSLVLAWSASRRSNSTWQTSAPSTPKTCTSRRRLPTKTSRCLRRSEPERNPKVLAASRLTATDRLFTAEFRYEAVAVIHKDWVINGIEGLKGLDSCHTGVGRNVGYKIPLTKLKQKGIIGSLNEPELSPRENELKAFSKLFNKACIVGKWSPDPKINLSWSEYSRGLWIQKCLFLF
jgi:hypothetical protein